MDNIKTTFHLFYHECQYETKELFDKKCLEICPENYEPVFEMNEFYITKNKGKGSDLVFETPHVDGPFCLIPGILLRCIYVIKGNESVITHIPNQHFCKSLKDDEYCMFDYHRDVHWIEIKQNTELNPRIVLKLHFIEKNHKVLKFLSIYYNTFARFLFINSIDKNLLSTLINFITNLFTFFVKTIHIFKII